MAYPTLDKFKNYLKVEDNDRDTLLEGLLNTAIAYVEEYTQRNFQGDAIAETAVIHPDQTATNSSGNLLLYLKYDLIGIDEVRIGTESEVATATPLADSKVIINDRDFGIVKLDATLPADQVIQIKYRHGNLETPAPISNAILAKAVFLADNTGHADLRRVGNVQLGDLNTFFWATTSPPQAVDKALDPYKHIYL